MVNDDSMKKDMEEFAPILEEEDGEIQDRVSQYLIPMLSEYLFDELSDEYLEKSGVLDILKGVPVPIKRSELSGMSNVMVAKNMAFVVGCDVNFVHRDSYLAYIEKVFTKDFAKPLINEGVEVAEKGNYEEACAYFRGAMMIDPENKDAFYCYGRAAKDAYDRGDDEEYIGRFKAESLTAFERVTLMAPDYDLGFYFLGFAYVNLGLYIKAKLTWEEFMKLSDNIDLKGEVSKILSQLEEPCRIEEGCNCVLSGRFDEGIRILSGYEDHEEYGAWWPLWFYLGMAYKGLGEFEVAEQKFLKVLPLSPSNIETMEELVEIYRTFGDDEKAEKYLNKIELVKKNAALDREEKRAAENPGLS